MTETRAQSAHVREYFSELETHLATIPASNRRGFLHRQLGVWERHEERLITWARADDGSPNPFIPPLTAWDCANIALRLASLVTNTEQEAA